MGDRDVHYDDSVVYVGGPTKERVDYQKADCRKAFSSNRVPTHLPDGTPTASLFSPPTKVSSGNHPAGPRGILNQRDAGGNLTAVNLFKYSTTPIPPYPTKAQSGYGPLRRNFGPTGKPIHFKPFPQSTPSPLQALGHFCKAATLLLPWTSPHAFPSIHSKPTSSPGAV